MSVRSRVRSIVLVSVVAWSLSGSTAGQVPTAAPPAAQSPAVPSADIVRLARATTDAERLAVVTGVPRLRESVGVSAIREYGTSLIRSRRYAEAELVHRALLWLGDLTNNDNTRADAWSGLGSLEGQRGNLTESLVYLEKALEIAERLGTPEGLQPVVANMAIVHRRLGDYETAENELGRALSLARQIGRRDSESRVYNNIGNLEFSRGNSKLAQEYFNRSLELKLEVGVDSLEIASSLNNIGALYEEQGDFEQALTYFQRARTLVEASGGGSAGTTTLLNVGHALAALGRGASARDSFERALDYARQGNDLRVEAAALFNLANLERDEGRLDAAESLHHRSLEIREGSGDVIRMVEGLSALTSLLLRQNRAAEAEGQISQAVEIAESVGLLHQLARAQLYQGQVFEALGRPDDALAVYERCANTVEWLRERTTGGEQARQVFLASRTSPYIAIANLHARAGRPLDALMATERARARTLLDILAAGRQPTRSMTEAERAEERELSRRVITASARVTGELQQPRPDESRVAAQKQALTEARLAREAFQSRLYATRPALRLIRGDAPVVRADQLSSIVAKGAVAVEFAVQMDAIWAYVITASEDGPLVTTVLLPTPASELLPLVDRFARQVAKRDLAFAAASRRLYSELLTPIESLIGREAHLMIVPDAALWRLPFQALETPRGTFLIEERSLSYAPSLSALAALQARQVARADREPFLVALGDPSGASVGPTTQRAVVGPLPEAAREVRALAKLYGAAHSEVFVHAEASEAALRASASRATVLHVATHGVLDDHAPMYSHLMLAGGRGAEQDGTDNDGRLESWELLNLDLNADLVVLSACQTASGLVGGGEGVIGLSWALLASGASTAVLSQWAVDSASTTELMIAFHEHRLRTGAGASESLRRAAMTLMKDPRYRHPFYWAGFITMGLN